MLSRRSSTKRVSSKGACAAFGDEVKHAHHSKVSSGSTFTSLTKPARRKRSRSTRCVYCEFLIVGGLLILILSVTLWANWSVSMSDIPICFYESCRLRHENFPSVQERIKLYMGPWYLPYCSKATHQQSSQSPQEPLFKQSYRTQLYNNSIPYTVLTVQRDRDNESLQVSGYAKNFEPILLQKHVLSDCRLTADQAAAAAATQSLPGERLSSLLLDERGNMITYCLDAFDLFVEMERIDLWRSNNWWVWLWLWPFHNTKRATETTTATRQKHTPILSQWGDKYANSSFPLIAKWRPSLTPAQVAQMSEGGHVQQNKCWPREFPVRPNYPIVWKLVSARHYWPIRNVAQNDVDWNDKLLAAVWRGSFTGVGNIHSPDNTHNNNGHPTTSKIIMDNETLCRNNIRCNFVYRWASSDMIDAGHDSTLGFIPKVINGVNLTKPAMNMKQLLRYKIIVSLEGNDVASGLKWQLYSNSVVMMPAPTKTSFAMEELLQPWVHYIPILSDGSDAADQVKWVLENDKKAKSIAERGKQWIYHLLYHEKAHSDNARIRHEILRRYRDLWNQ